jgi:hypothetical protein
MPKWKIYYSDHEVLGETEDDWLAAPNNDVQIVVLYEPTSYRGWTGIEDGRMQLWTGDDEYSLYGWNVKYGKLMNWDEYNLIWERVIADTNIYT